MDKMEYFFGFLLGIILVAAMALIFNLGTHHGEQKALNNITQTK